MSDSHREVMTLIYPENCGQLSGKKNSIKDTDVGELKKKKRERDSLSKETLKVEQ